MDIEGSLAQIGLSKNQIKVYLALLQLGQGTIQEITLKSKIKRTSVYNALDNLTARDLVTFQDKGWHRQYFAESPKKVLLTFKNEQRSSIEKEKKFMEILPELNSLFNAEAEKPKIKFYDGMDGIRQIYDELMVTTSNAEMLAYGSAVNISKYFGTQWLENYHQTRVKRKISVRAVLEDSPDGQSFKQEDRKENRQTRLIPKEKFPFSNLINILGNKVFIISFKNQLGVIIESTDVAQTQRSFFKLAWLGAERLKKNA